MLQYWKGGVLQAMNAPHWMDVLASLVVGLPAAVLLLAVMTLYGALLDRLRNRVGAFAGGWTHRLTFFGVIHHELSHLLLAFVLGAKITGVCLFRWSPAQDGSIGQIRYVPRGTKLMQAMQVALSSAGPLLLGTLDLYLAVRYLHPLVTWPWRALLLYLEISVVLHMSLSRQDIKNILSRAGWVILVLTVVLGAFFLANKEAVLALPYAGDLWEKVVSVLQSTFGG